MRLSFWVWASCIPCDATHYISCSIDPLDLPPCLARKAASLRGFTIVVLEGEDEDMQLVLAPLSALDSWPTPNPRNTVCFS